MSAEEEAVAGHDAGVAGALDELTRRWRRRWPTRLIPGFDPGSAREAARILVLTQSPARSTAVGGAAAVCGEGNDNATARAIVDARRDAGLRRDQYLRWNAIPWPTEGTPRAGEAAEAREALEELVAALPQLRAIVAVGAVARRAVSQLAAGRGDIPIFFAPHPSPASPVPRDVKHREAVLAFAAASAAALGDDKGTS
ncbi:uracil-DNA glycosylase family protein [Schumannella sp. 10F1B-5-1]|uniref:uracil-DNA glycosylase family protein n=1 Tax=Schumannella sp. 10F1B-5-1 TaxID=2590780 RepID=UPI001C642E5F|nr:uracil-DNA glycosylase family protein [Schumannella sp. 10F1B-5-1]